MNKKTFTLSFFAAWLASPSTVFGSNYFEDIIGRLLDMVVWPIFLGIVVIMFIFAGLKFLTAQGDPGKVGEARKALMWAVIGVAVGILAFSAEGIIKSILGA